MCDANSLFGFEILQQLYNNHLSKKEDLLILFVHWYLIKHGFRCIGIGDSKTYDPSEKGSELLPEGWNSRPNYALRYVNNSKLYLFLGIKSEEDLLLHLLRVEDQQASNAHFPINQTINDIRGPLESVIPSYQLVLNTLENDFANPLVPCSTAENSTQTSTANEGPRDDPLRVDPLRVGPRIHPPSASQPWDPTNVGGADLNPFGRGGGGMIFDPFAPQRNPVNPNRPGLGIPGRLPPGAIPPFARFDPFGPPDTDRPRPPRDPDNDHLPPPGYDDMFM